jgi:hypothetical protein
MVPRDQGGQPHCQEGIQGGHPKELATAEEVRCVPDYIRGVQDMPVIPVEVQVGIYHS